MKLLRILSVHLLLALTLLTTPRGQAQAGKAPSPGQGPLATVKSFLKAFDYQEGNWKDRALACLDRPAGMSQDDLWLAAIQLLGVINRLDERIGGTHVPEVKGNLAVFFPQAINFQAVAREADGAGRIELVRNGERWLFSTGTIRGIEKLYDALVDLPERRFGTLATSVMSSLWLRAMMPPGLRHDFLNLEYWQWLGIFLVILIGVLLDYTTRFILGLVTKRTLNRVKSYVSSETMARAVRPIGLCVAAFLWVSLLPMIGLRGSAMSVIKGAAAVFAVLAGTWAAWRIVDLVAEAAEYRASRTVSKVDDIVIPLLRKSVKIFILIFGAIYAAESMSIEIAPLIASLGIGGLAFAFAAKDTIENFFGSVAVLLDRPFHVGDWVVIGEVEGIVEVVGFRSTRIRTFYNSLVTVPNSTLVRAKVDNYGMRKYRRTKCHIGVQYNTSPEQLLAFREGIMELVRTHPYTRKDYFQVWFHRFGPSSLDLLIYVFFEVPDWSTELRERERLFLDIMRLARQLGVEFAFPTQTVHLVRQEDDPREEPGAAPTSMSDLRARVTGIRAVQDLVANQPWQKEKPGPVVYSEGPTILDGLDDDEIPGQEMRET